MYILNDLARTAQDEKLRVAARQQLRGRAAARRAGSRKSSPRRLADPRILHVLRGRRSAQAH